MLNGVYNTDRKVISDYLLNLLKFVETTDIAVMSAAFVYYGETKLDFVDCILAVFNLVGGKNILTFDKKLNNFMKRKADEK